MKFIGITACTAGIAHTYMAQAALEKKGAQMGHTVKIETQGSIGIENELTAREIADADAVIFAVESAIEGEERFENKKILRVNIKEAISHPEDVIKKAELL